MILSKKTNAHKLLPTQWVKNLESLALFVFGSSIERKVGLYQKYLSERDPKYLKWAIHTLVNWEQEVFDPEDMNCEIHVFWIGSQTQET